jgi:hypothetical protein
VDGSSQGILKLWLALQHGDAPTITGHQLRASMELHTIEIGLPGQMLQQDFKIFRQLATISWLKHLWEFCNDSNIQSTSTTPKLTLLYEKAMNFSWANSWANSQVTDTKIPNYHSWTFAAFTAMPLDSQTLAPETANIYTQWQELERLSYGLCWHWILMARAQKTN